MFRSLSRKRRFGFTLVEVLVTTVVVGVMAAVVIPAMVKQATAGDSPRVASDLGSVKAAMEVFSQNVRPRMPGDIEDLINPITQSDIGLDGTVYSATNVGKWKGPYLQWTATSSTTNDLDDVVFNSGGGGSVVASLYRCPQASTAASYSGAAGDAPCTLYTTTGGVISDAYGTVKVTGIPAAVGGVASNEFRNLNTIIDGEDGTTDAERQDRGLLRQNASGTVFFLAVPYSAP